MPCGLRQEICLRDLPEACYPAPDPANKLATARAKQVKEGVQHPFPWVDLAEFVPSWANVVRAFMCQLLPCQRGLIQVTADGETKGRLSAVKWFAAYQGFALAAHATEVICHWRTRLHVPSCFLLQVWQYTSCQAHVRICMEIASAKTLGLAQTYDEMVRREWSEKAKRGMHWSIK